MNRRILTLFGLGAVSACGFAAFVLVLCAQMGVLPTQADIAPGRLEAALFSSALRASVEHHAPGGGNPLPASSENLLAGAKLYQQMCARCHGSSWESENPYGRSFYPPAPNLLLSRPSYTDSEMYWIVKHGIRNTAMPAWGNLLPDEGIWQVVTFLRKPPAD
jgi:mono/diheme cytochrome c family protein